MTTPETRKRPTCNDSRLLNTAHTTASRTEGRAVIIAETGKQPARNNSHLPNTAPHPAGGRVVITAEPEAAGAQPFPPARRGPTPPHPAGAHAVITAETRKRPTRNDSRLL
ncbi:hypothetical protein, partial [Actinophytocola sp.]|uniref:hypothetical protein n=1 Tax=Actinophytocola sp. TaxID=1872138 RepID=UPI00389AA26A